MMLDIADSNHVAGSCIEECLNGSLKFIVEFRRHSEYMGEYGFDWMRSTYQYFSEDYLCLKSEYTTSTVAPKDKGFHLKLDPPIVEGQEYFVPWLSFLPEKEKKIRLSLKISFLEGMVQSTDKITFLSNDTKITFSESVIFLDNHFVQLDDNQRHDLQALKDYRDMIGTVDINSYTVPDLVKLAEDCNETLITKIYKTFFTDMYVIGPEYKMLGEIKVKMATKSSHFKGYVTFEVRLKLENELKELEKKLKELEVIVLRKLKINIIKGLTKLIERGREPVANIEITLICKGELSNNTLITVNDKNGKPVGYLKVLKNSNYKDFEFDIIPIRVLRSGNNNDLALINKEYPGNKALEEHLNSQVLSQTLLKCSITKPYDLFIRESEWMKEGCIITGENNFKCFDEKNMSNEISLLLKQAIEKQHNELSKHKKRGVFMFLMPLVAENDKFTSIFGAGELGIIQSQYLVIYKYGLSDNGTYAHEIAHVLGLEHSFLDEQYLDAKSRDQAIEKDSDIVNKRVDDINKAEAKVSQLTAEEKKLAKEIKKFKAYDDEINRINKKNGLTLFDKKFIHSDKKVLELWRKTDEKHKKVEKEKLEAEAWVKKLESEWRSYSYTMRKNYYEGWNPHKFEFSSTENIMDYRNSEVSFWKFQWLAMQEDVKRYYNKKK